MGRENVHTLRESNCMLRAKVAKLEPAGRALQESLAENAQQKAALEAKVAEIEVDTCTCNSLFHAAAVCYIPPDTCRHLYHP